MGTMITFYFCKKNVFIVCYFEIRIYETFEIFYSYLKKIPSYRLFFLNYTIDHLSDLPWYLSDPI